MSLKIIKIEPRLARIITIVATLLCLTAAWFFIKWNFANVIASRVDAQRPESKLVVEWLIQTAPADPQAHFAAAVVFEKTLDADDLTRSLSEYETATALSPHNYLMWLGLGKARSIIGDPEGAQAAYSRALELAPNYSVVQWAYGNSLIRQDKTAEGFSMMAKAAESNPAYSRSAVITALQIFDGDVAQVRQALGDTDVTNAALATALAGQERYEEAFGAWSKIAAEDRSGKFKTVGEPLLGQMATAKKFQLAARIASDLWASDSEKPVIGQICNGGFESGVKLRNAALFEWQIADGVQPQVGLSEGQPHGGKYSLWMIFNSFESANFRSISQTVPVVPSAAYDFEVFYRSDLKTAAAIKWEIADAATTTAIASTPPMKAAGDWTPLRVTFTAPAGSDGVIIRLVREGCSGPSCPVTGKILFDDFSIRRL